MVNGTTTSILGAVLVWVGLQLLRRHFDKQLVLPLPPGPKGLPIIGNLMNLPRSHQWKTFVEWGEEYGAIVHITVLGQHIIILHDAGVAMEMMDNKSRIYSDRPTFVMAGKLVGWDEGPALIDCNDTFREYRRLMHRILGSRSKIEKFSSLLQSGMHHFLKRMLATPDAMVDNSRKITGALMLKLVYGYQALEENDPFITLVDDAIDMFSETTTPGTYIVDAFPFLRYLPSWIPGSATAVVPEYKQLLRDMIDVPYKFVQEQISIGAARPSFTSDLLQDKEVTAKEEYNIKWAAAGVYSGGADTTVSAISTFYLAMTRYQDTQKKAQAEIDAVIGGERLPTLADRALLPYVDALVSEVHRWGPVGHLTIPHKLREDDVHDGHFIPKGSIIIANSWHMLHDPETYAKPHEFIPERFLATEGRTAERDPRNVAFGFGRRLCPGMHLADASVL